MDERVESRIGDHCLWFSDRNCLRYTGKRKYMLSDMLILLFFLFKAGQWIINLVDYYGSTFVIFGLAVFEITGISWIYGQ